jgi:DNA-directed RNA polymerase subunit RPC12/RpoP
MARLESVNCPHCGAPLSIDAAADRVRCNYCGSTSLVQRTADPPPGGAPVILVKSPAVNLALLLGLAAVLVVGAVSLTALSLRQPGPPAVFTASTQRDPPAALPEARPKATAPETALRLDPRRPLELVDVNGDGRSEIVASVVLRTGATESRHFAVFDSQSGALKARTPPLENLDEALAAVLGKRLVIANPLGEVVAYDLSSGDRQWTSTLGEPALALCAPRRAGAMLVLSGSRGTMLDLITGRQSETSEPCRSPLARSDVASAPRYRGDDSAPRGTEGILCGSVRVMGSQDYTVPDACFFRAHLDTSKLGGMVGHRLWSVEKGWLVFGVRRPAPYVPMVGRLQRGRFVWQTEVPAENPLAADDGGPRHVALVGDELVIGYSERREQLWHLTAFALADGARRFAVGLEQLSGGLRALSAADDTIVAQDDDGFWLLDARTGSVRTKVGGAAPRE